MRLQDNQCLNALSPKKVQTGKTVTKVNPKITAKRHAHLQALTKNSAKFQKDTAKTVGEVAFTRFFRDSPTDEQGKTMSPSPNRVIVIRVMKQQNKSCALGHLWKTFRSYMEKTADEFLFAKKVDTKHNSVHPWRGPH